MNLLIVGAPGVGKGTQAFEIVKHFNVTHISTGDMFREAITNQTEIGKLASSFIEKGLLVPDSVTIEIVKERLKADDIKKGFLLDGFPRDLHQAEALDKILKEMGTSLDYVIDIAVDKDVLVPRIEARRVCPSCKASFNLISNKPKVDGVCDYCGAELIHREDDTRDTILKRMNVYEEKTAVILNHYQDKVVHIDGNQTPEAVFNDILMAVGK